MNRTEKRNFVSKVRDEFSKSSTIIVTHYAGLNVKQIEELRKSGHLRTRRHAARNLKEKMDKKRKEQLEIDRLIQEADDEYDRLQKLKGKRKNKLKRKKKFVQKEKD